MASQTQGIQQLLAAEKSAAAKVAEARKRKNKRLKQAKEEAQAEIEKYKKGRDQEFKEYEFRYIGSKDDIIAKIDNDTKNQIDAMNRSMVANKDPVINALINLVCDIKPKVHQNYKSG